MLGMGYAGDGGAEAPDRLMRPPGNSKGRKKTPATPWSEAQREKVVLTEPEAGIFPGRLKPQQV